jgi:vacuolar-type H+-ATPase subunit H
MSETKDATLSDLGGSIAALRQLKQIESEWEQKLAAAREEGDKVLGKLREEIEAAVHDARAAAEKDREKTLQTARGAADEEAKRILEVGKAGAQGIGTHSAKDFDAVKEKLIDIVVGEFRPKSKSSGA